MKVMDEWKLLKCLLLVVFTCVYSSAACIPNINNEDASLPVLPYASEFQAAIDQVLIKYPDHDLGISASVSVPGYRTWTGVSGSSQPGDPITANMLFNVGSVAKNFEAALVLKLVEDGVLSLDDPVEKYLPPYKYVDGKITLRQLLDHSSGIFNVFEHPDFPWVRTDVDYARQWQPEEVFNHFVLEPYGPPGYAQHYSSTNYLLVTEIIEAATRSTVPEEIERYFTGPMQLEHTYVSMGSPPPAQFSVAHPWVDINRDGILEDLYGIPLTWSASLTHPVMFSTPDDLVQWLNALYRDGTVLNSGSLAEMLSIPEISMRDPEGGLYGLGTIDFIDRLGMHTQGHSGSSLGYCALAFYLPEYGVSLAILINTGESPAELAGYMLGDSWSGFKAVIRENQERLE